MSKTIVIGASQSNVDVDLVDNLSQSGIIESQDGGDLITFKTTDGSEAVIVGGDGAKLSVNQASPTAQVHAKSVADVAMTGGTVSTSGSSTTLTGSGTSFKTDFTAGSAILVGTDARTVDRVNSDTQITLTAAVTASASTAAKKDRSLIKLERSNGETGFEVTNKGHIHVLSGEGVADNIVIGSTTTMPGNANGTTQRNIAIGEAALGTETSGNHNIALGRTAGNVGTGMNQRVMIGARSNGGTNTVAIGHDAGNSSQAAQNVFVGAQAGNMSVITGTNNVIIGFDADLRHTGGDPDQGEADENCVVLGASAVGEGTNTIRLGNSSIDSTNGLFCADTGIASSSDSRIKQNVADSTLGLDFLKTLRPVSYQKMHPADYPAELLETRFKSGRVDSEGNAIAPDTKPDGWTPKTEYGLIAQEVKAAMESVTGADDFHGHNTTANGTETIKYVSFVTVLIKAVQELETRLAALEGGS